MMTTMTSPETMATSGGHQSRSQFMIPGSPCGTGLSVATVTDVYHLYRFAPLTVASTTRPLPATLRLETPVSSGISVARTNRVIAQPLLNVDGSLNELPEAPPIPVAVKDVDAFLATRRVSTPHGDFDAQLTPAVVDLLLGGQTAVVSASPVGGLARSGSPQGPTGLRSLVASDRPAGGSAGSGPAPGGPRSLVLVPQAADATPAPISVPNLSAFLSDPALDVGGSLVPVTLPPAGVRDLRAGKPTLVDLNGTPLPLQVAPQPQTTQASAPSPSSPSAPPQQSVPQSYLDLVLWLPWTQTWSLEGYARGELLSSISMAPQEELTISVFSWDRRTVTTEETSSVESSNNLDVSDTTRSTVDVMSELATRNQLNWDAKGNLKVNYDGAEIGIGGGASSQQTVSDTVKTTTNVIHEATMKSSSTIKQSRQTKISQTEESGQENRVTRTLRNPNMCRTLDIDLFEVIANWNVTTAFSVTDVRACMLLDNPVKVAFNRNTVRHYESALRRGLLDPGVADGFAAARLLDARNRACDVLCSTCTCGGGSAADQSWANSLTTALAITKVLSTQSQYSLFEYYDDYVNAIASVYTGSGGQPPTDRLLTEARWWAYWRLLVDGALDVANELARLANVSNPSSDDAASIAAAIAEAGGLSALEPQALYKQWHDQLMTDTHYAFNTWSNPNLDDWNVSGFVIGQGSTFNMKQLFENWLSYPDDHGLLPALDNFLSAYKNQQQGATAAAQTSQSATDAINSTWSLQDVAQAEERLDALLAHLRDHANYYRYTIYQELAANDAYNPLIALGGNVSWLFEPGCVGFDGNKLAFPLTVDAAGLIIPPLITNNPDIQSVSQATSVVLPTNAVAGEARLGKCEGCEPFIEDSRKIDLRLRRAKADQADEETKRFAARLAATPPLLGDPVDHDEPVLKVQIVDSTTGP